MRKLLLLFGLLCASTVHAQGTFTAASCSFTDVNAVVNGPTHVAVDGDTIVLPLCSNTTVNPLVGNTWGDGTTTNIQKLVINVSLKIIGQDSPGGNQGGAQKTIIIDNNYKTCSGPSAQPIIQINTVSTHTSTNIVRLTGFTIRAGNTNDSGFCGAHIRDGSGAVFNYRIDHIEFDDDSFAGGACPGNGDDGIQFSQDEWGVTDHNQFNNCRRHSVFMFGTGFGGGNSADQSWALADSMGHPGFPANGLNAPTDTVQAAHVMEDNTFNQLINNTGGNPIACEQGARCVARFNTLASQGSHGYEQTSQGVRMWEEYGNTFVLSTYAPAGGSCGGAISQTCPNSVAMALRSGNGVFFENTATSGTYNYVSILGLYDFRCNNDGCSGFAPWGQCNGTSNWDFVPSTGPKPCIGQMGRGQGNLINRSVAAWPHQKLDSVYDWQDKMDGVLNNAQNNNPGSPQQIFANLDYFDATASFNGTSGMGVGTLASIPSTCSTFTAQDGAVTGVGYWANDQGNWNQISKAFWDGTSQGILYKCFTNAQKVALSSPTCQPQLGNGNWWCQWYEPFTYPHPLVSTLPPTPKISFSPNPLPLPTPVVGTGGSGAPITISNPGTATTTITSITITGPNASAFSEVSSTCSAVPINIAAGANCNIIVNFLPLAVGAYSAQLNFFDNVVGTPQSVAISGNGISPNVPSPAGIFGAANLAGCTVCTGTSECYCFTQDRNIYVSKGKSQPYTMFLVAPVIR